MFLIDLLYVMSVWMCIPQALDFVSRLPQLIHAKTSAGNPENHSRFAKPLSDVGTASTFSRMHIWTIHTSLYRCAERAWLCTTHTLLWIHLGCLPICTMCAHTHTHTPTNWELAVVLLKRARFSLFTWHWNTQDKMWQAAWGYVKGRIWNIDMSWPLVQERLLVHWFCTVCYLGRPSSLQHASCPLSHQLPAFVLRTG